MGCLIADFLLLLLQRLIDRCLYLLVYSSVYFFIQVQPPIGYSNGTKYGKKCCSNSEDCASNPATDQPSTIHSFSAMMLQGGENTNLSTIIPNRTSSTTIAR